MTTIRVSLSVASRRGVANAFGLAPLADNAEELIIREAAGAAILGGAVTAQPSRHHQIPIPLAGAARSAGRSSADRLVSGGMVLAMLSQPVSIAGNRENGSRV